MLFLGGGLSSSLLRPLIWDIGALRFQRGGPQAEPAFSRAAVALEPFWADLQPRVALVERGGSLWLNCSTNCPRPERGGLETSLRRNGTQRGLRWLARQLVDIREPETQPVCFFRCARRTLQARGLIRTFREFWVVTPLRSLDLPFKLRPPALTPSFPCATG